MIGKKSFLGTPFPGRSLSCVINRIESHCSKAMIAGGGNYNCWLNEVHGCVDKDSHQKKKLDSVRKEESENLKNAR